MDLPLVYLLAGLIVIGISIPSLVVPAEAKVSRGAILQFLFGAVLVAVAFINIGRFV